MPRASLTNKPFLNFVRWLGHAALALTALALVGCHATPTPGDQAYVRKGDEIMVAGQLFHTNAPVVLWTDPGGYDAYRVEKRFGPIERASWEAMQKEGRGPETPARYNTRFFRIAEKQPTRWWPDGPLPPEQIARLRGGGWSLPELQQVVDQFILHYDACGTSRTCFRVLHDVRGLSVHFMLDLDGTIYQTCDLKERTWHATVSNDRSIGIEIANMGAYTKDENSPLPKWYAKDESGQTYITIPDDQGDGGIRTPNFVGRPARNEPVTGVIQGRLLTQYDFTPQQYDSLIKLTAALGTVFPKLTMDYPRDAQGGVLTTHLADEDLVSFRGVLGHYHMQEDKADPGPALDWEKVVGGARKLMRPQPKY